MHRKRHFRPGSKIEFDVSRNVLKLEGADIIPQLLKD